MGKKGGGGGTTSTTTVNEPPAFIQDAYKDIIAKANNVYDLPLKQYQGQQVAGFTPMQQQSFTDLNAARGIQQPYLDKASGLVDRGTQDLWSGVPQFNAENIAQYFNPYQSNVIDSTMAQIRHNNAVQNQALTGNSIAKGAWGGDRSGIAQAELMRGQDANTNSTLASLNSTGYSQAVQNFLDQQKTQLGANSQSASNALQGAGIAGGLGDKALQDALTQAQAELSAGTQQQQQDQNELNVPMQQFQEQQQYPYSQLQTLTNLVSAISGGAGGTTTATGTAPKQNSGSNVLGTALSIAGMIPWSDKRLKEDIKEVGKTKDGQPIYTFKYKGQNMTQMGLMAQDVEKKHPEAVHEIGGLKAVDYDAATRESHANGGIVGRGVAPRGYYHGGGISPMNFNAASLSAPQAAALPTAAPDDGGGFDVSSLLGLLGGFAGSKGGGTDGGGLLGFLGSSGMANTGHGNTLMNMFKASPMGGGYFGPGFSRGGIVRRGYANAGMVLPFNPARNAAPTNIGMTDGPNALNSPEGLAALLRAVEGGGIGTPAAPIQAKLNAPVAAALPTADIPAPSPGIAPAVEPAAGGIAPQGNFLSETFGDPVRASLLKAAAAAFQSNTKNFGQSIGDALSAGVDQYSTMDKTKTIAAQKAAMLAENARRYQATEDYQKGMLDVARQKAAGDVDNSAFVLTPPGSKAASNGVSSQDPVAASIEAIADQQGKTGVSPAQRPDLAGAVSGAVSTGGASGDEFLSMLPAQTASQVKALGDGRMAFPSGFALKSPYWQKMLQAVSQYDPSFDAINYNARSKTRNDFTSGKSAQNIKSLNTAIGHLGTLNDQIDDTSGVSFPMIGQTINKGINAYKEGSGDPGITKFKQTAGALSSELTQVFRGSGGAEADVKRYLAELNPDASAEQKKAAVKNVTDLLQSRIQAISDQYDKGMGKSSDPLSLLDPKAASVIKKLSGDSSSSSSGATQGGVLHVDKDGNKAIVYPDGSYKEVP